jgi:hypothetical protein
MRRAYVRGTPHLYPKQKADGATAAALDNWLEHVVIYGRQLELCPNFSAKLNTGLQEFWHSCPWSHSTKELKFNLISRYMITHRYASDTTRGLMREAIERLGPS